MNIYLIKMTAGWNDKYSHKNMKLCNQLTYVFKREKNHMAVTNQIALDSDRKT